MPSQAIRLPQLAVPGLIEQLDVTPTELEVVDDDTITTIYGPINIPAGALGTDRLLQVGIVGDYLNNTAGAEGLTFRVQFDGVTFYQDASGTIITQSATRRGVLWTLTMSNRDVTNAQIGGGRIVVGAALAATTGTGGIAALETANRIGAEYTTIVGAVDTTVSTDVTFSIQHTVADAAVSFRVQLAWTKIARVS